MGKYQVGMLIVCHKCRSVEPVYVQQLPVNLLNLAALPTYISVLYPIVSYGHAAFGQVTGIKSYARRIISAQILIPFLWLPQYLRARVKSVL